MLAPEGGMEDDPWFSPGVAGLAGVPGMTWFAIVPSVRMITSPSEPRGLLPLDCRWSDDARLV